MVGSCIAEILCMFADPYDGYMAPMCKHPNEIIKLIEYSGVEIPQSYTKNNCDPNDLTAAHNFLIDTTQSKFRNRKAHQERAEALVPEWITSKAQEIIDIATELNLLAENPPHQKQYDCAAILGSTTPQMEKRIGYFVSSLYKGLKVQETFLLTGERLIDSKKYSDGSNEYLESVASKFRLEKSQVSEQHLMQDVYDRLCLAQSVCKAIPYKMIYSQPTVNGRAHTIDTLEDFAKNYINTSKCKSIVFVSNSPFIQYQYEIIYKFMKDKGYNMDYEVIGPKAHTKEATNLAKAAHYILMAFAESLHASRDRIRASIKLLQNKRDGEL